MTIPMLVMYMIAVLFGADEIPPPTGEYGRLSCPDGYSRDLDAEDEVWLARAIECEAGRYAGGIEGDAVAWSLASRYCQVHPMYKRFGWLARENARLAGMPTAPFARLVVSYCQCINPAWGSAGTKWTPRGIKERVDYYRRIPLADIPQRSRDTARRFLVGESRNPLPGVTRWLSQGFEEFADLRWIGPIYLNPRGGNAFYRVPETVRWHGETVRVVAPVPTAE